MSQHSRTDWQWDSSSRRWYQYDAQTGQYVFEDGQRTRQMPQDPRTSFASAASTRPASPAAASTPTSNYVADPTSWSARQSASSRQLARPSAQSSRTIADPVTAVTRDVSRLGLQSHQQRGQAGQQQTGETNQRDEGSSGRQSGTAGPRVTTFRDKDGLIHAEDRSSGVATVIKTAPAQDITDPYLYQAGISAQSKLFPTDGETERLFNTFVRRSQPRNFFVYGRVFFTLWAEPAGESNTLATGVEMGTHKGRYGERVYSKVRRFVVIREGNNFCSCLPIVTHRDQGVAKQGVKKSDFSIIYTLKLAPAPKPNELPNGNESGMRPKSIRVSADDPLDKLSTMSRLDYGKVHTVHHNVKVRNLGKVHPHSNDALIENFNEVWAKQTNLARTQMNTAQPQAPIGHPGSSHGNTVSNAPAAVRQHQTRDRRDSHSAYSKTSDKSHGSREKQHRPQRQRSTAAGADESESGESSHNEAPNAALEAGVKAAVERLRKRGYTNEQAVAAVKKHLEQRNTIEEEDNTGSESDDQTQHSTRSRDDQRQDRKTSEAQRSTRSKSQARHQGQFQDRSESYLSGASAHTEQRSSSQWQGAAQQNTRSSTNEVRSGSTAKSDQAARAANAEAAIQQVMAQGYSKEQAIQIIRERLKRNGQ